jgi:hypothetical protein
LYHGGGGAVGVRLGEGEYGVAPGQACVFYADADPRARVLGGGWIASATGDDVHRSAGFGKRGRESGHELAAANEGGAQKRGVSAPAAHGAVHG